MPVPKEADKVNHRKFWKHSLSNKQRTISGGPTRHYFCYTIRQSTYTPPSSYSSAVAFECHAAV